MRYALNMVELKGFLTTSNMCVSTFPCQLLMEKYGFSTDNILSFNQAMKENGNRKFKKNLLKDFLRKGCVVNNNLNKVSELSVVKNKKVSKR